MSRTATASQLLFAGGVKVSGVVPSVMVLKVTVELEKSAVSVFSVQPPVLPVIVLAACVPV
jgi:hypothetical protein